MSTAPFQYDNVSPRPTGPVLRAMSRMLPGVRSVQRQVLPYAEAWREANARALTQEEPLWVALGDSMTQGIGASDPQRGFVGQLQERWAARGHAYRVVNLSVTGARIDDVVERQLVALDRLVELGHRPVLVTVLAASNDIVNRTLRTHAVERFAVLLDALPPGSVVGNLPNPQRAVRQMDAELRRRDAEGSLRLADFKRGGPPTWVGLLAPDWFHPDDRGYRVMADVVDRVVVHTPGPRRV